MNRAEVPTLETQRLRLRGFRWSDLDDYAALTSDREVMRYLGGGPDPWDRGRSWRHLAFLMGHWQLACVGIWALELRETGELAGMVGYSEPAGWPGFELSWALARRLWGCGFATEGARAALGYAFGVWGKERVVSLIDPANRRSLQVAERLGERLRGRIQHGGKEMLCYGIDADEFGAPVALGFTSRSAENANLLPLGH